MTTLTVPQTTDNVNIPALRLFAVAEPYRFTVDQYLAMAKLGS